MIFLTIGLFTFNLKNALVGPKLLIKVSSFKICFSFPMVSNEHLETLGTKFFSSCCKILLTFEQREKDSCSVSFEKSQSKSNRSNLYLVILSAWFGSFGSISKPPCLQFGSIYIQNKICDVQYYPLTIGCSFKGLKVFPAMELKRSQN